MKELRFKTNINCGSCVRAVTPHLNNENNIIEWGVDTYTENKILTIVAKDDLEPGKVEKLISDAGFEAEFVER
jgi:copper chaperone